MNDVAAFVAAHPNCRYGEIRSGVTASEGRLDAALKEARARGLIRLEGIKIKSRYFPVTLAVTEPVLGESRRVKRGCCAAPRLNGLRRGERPRARSERALLTAS